MSARQRGNLLLTAIFIAVFLFFLSAALVSSNREDVLYALSANHRLQADMAAEGALNLALQTMKTDPNWEQTLTNAHGTLASGATWSAQVQPTADPVQNTTYLHQITGTGVAGGTTQTEAMTVEEFRMAPSLPQSQEAMFFTMGSTGDLLIMNHTFNWTDLGPAPRLDAWLVANAGPLFTLAPEGTASAPNVMDWQPTYGQFGILEPGNPVQVPIPDASLDEHTIYLVFRNGQATWNDVTDPVLQLKNTQPFRIDGVPNGGPKFQTAVGANASVTYASSNFQGPMVDWYGLRGPGMVANGNVIYCHAIHYFYTGVQFQNHVSVVRGVIVSNPVYNPAQILEMPAVLSYDVQAQTWSKVVDTMQIPSTPYQVPPPYAGPQPDMSSMGLLQSTVMALQQGSLTQILQGQKNAWAALQTGPGLSKGLYAYKNNLLLHQSDGLTADNLPQFSLSGLSPESELSVVQNDSKGDILDTSNQFVPRIFRPAMTQNLTTLADLNGAVSFTTPSLGANCVAVLGNDLYTMARVRTTWIQEQGQYLNTYPAGYFNTPIDTLAICHYDGQHWQIWPGGMFQQSLLTGVGNSMQLVTAGGQQVLASPEHLAVAVYASSAPPLRRYTPIVVGR
ncbi:MAG: hypothetical protein ACYCW6_15115 [Candidatus Xenobia bacterium]